jgi:DNA-binding IclR family transcriptional regulator
LTGKLSKVLAILDLFTEERLEWTPEELIERLGYSRPTLYRYLKALKEAGFLVSLPHAGFTLGPRVVEMDYLLRRSDPLILNSSASLHDLTKRFPCTALVVRWYGDKLLCVASECSTENPLSSYARGRPMPLGRGAISRSIIAFLPRRQLLAMIENTKADLREIGLGQTNEEILKTLKQVRKTGCAIAHGEVTPGVIGIAAPIFDAGRVPIASICVTMAGQLVSGGQIDEVGTHVRRWAAEVSARLSDTRLHRHDGFAAGDATVDHLAALTAGKRRRYVDRAQGEQKP